MKSGLHNIIEHKCKIIEYFSCTHIIYERNDGLGGLEDGEEEEWNEEKFK